MSVLSFDAATWVPLAVLGASVAGSGHCVAMCGPLVAAVARDRRAWVHYHSGRLLGYLALGAIAGQLGEQVMRARTVSFVSAVTMAALFFLSAYRVARGRPLHLPLLPKRWLSWLLERGSRTPFACGSLTALLPCGWLHAFVLASIATGSLARGAGMLFLFWAGTLPALMGGAWILEKTLAPLVRRTPIVPAILLFVAGLACLGLKSLPLSGGGAAAPSCHAHHSP